MWCGVFFFAVLVILVSRLRGGFCAVCVRGVGVLFVFVCVEIGWQGVILRCKLPDGGLWGVLAVARSKGSRRQGCVRLVRASQRLAFRGRLGCPVLLSFHARLGSPGRSRRLECLLPCLGCGPLWGCNCRKGRFARRGGVWLLRSRTSSRSGYCDASGPPHAASRRCVRSCIPTGGGTRRKPRRKWVWRGGGFSPC